MSKIDRLCTSCENCDTDKYGFWCQALYKMSGDDKSCPGFESKYKQTSLNIRYDLCDSCSNMFSNGVGRFCKYHIDGYRCKWGEFARCDKYEKRA